MLQIHLLRVDWQCKRFISMYHQVQDASLEVAIVDDVMMSYSCVHE